MNFTSRLQCPGNMLRHPACTAALLLGLWVLELWPYRLAGSEWIACSLAGCVLALERHTLVRGFGPILPQPFKVEETLFTAAALAGFLVSLLASALQAGGRLPAFLQDPRGGPQVLFAASATLLAARRLARWLSTRCSARSVDAPRESPPGHALDPERPGRLLGSWVLAVGALCVVSIISWCVREGDVMSATSGLMAILAAISLEATRNPGGPTLAEASSFFRQQSLREICENLESASAVDTVVFERTGVLTLGKPRVAATQALREGLGADDILHLAAVAEYSVIHPYREAVLRSYRSHLRTVANVRNVETLPARGVRAKYLGKELLLGNLCLFREEGWPKESLDVLEAKVREWSARGETVVFVAHGGEILGAISFLDPLRQDAPEAFQELSMLGIRPVVQSGDSPESVSALRAQLGSFDVSAGLRPVDRARIADQLERQGRTVATVGKGPPDPDGDEEEVQLLLRWRSPNREAGASKPVEVRLEDGKLTEAARLLRVAQEYSRSRRRGLTAVGAYHAFVVPWISGALYPLTGVGPHPVFAAILGASLPVVLCLAVRRPGGPRRVPSSGGFTAPLVPEGRSQRSLQETV